MLWVKGAEDPDFVCTDESIRRTVAAYSPMLLRIAMTRLSSPADAEDVVQEVFLKLLTTRRTSGTWSTKRRG